MLQRSICFIVLCIVVPAAGAQPPGHGAVDLLGDPLPDGAIARLGTLRLKHGAVVESMAFSPDGRVLASKSGKSIGSIRLWDAATGKQLPGPWNDAAKSFSAFAFSHDGSCIAAAHATATEKLEDREIIVWDIATGLAVKVLAGKADFVQALAFTGDDKTLVAAGPEGVRWWNLALGKEVSVWQPLERENQSAKSRGAPTKGIFNSWLSSDGKSLALAVVTNPMRLVTIEDNGSATLGIWGAGPVEGFGFHLVTCVETWRRALDADNFGQLAIAFSTDGKRLVYSEQKDTLALRDAISGESIASVRAPGDAKPTTTAPSRLARFEIGFGASRFRPHHALPMLPSSTSKLAVSRNPTMTASIGGQGHVFIRDQKSPDSVRQILPGIAGWPNDYASAVALSPDAKSIAVAAGMCLSVIDVKTLRETIPFEGNRRAVNLVTFSADGKRVITANSGAVIGPSNPVTWSTSTWKALPAKEGPANLPPGGIGSLDGLIYLAIHGDQRGTIYNVASGKSVARLDVNVASALDESAKGINGAHFTLGTHARATAFFSTDSRYFVLLGEHDIGMPAYQVCSASSGKLLGTFPAPGQALQLLHPLAFSADGRLVGCFSPAVEVIQVFDIESGKIIRRLRNSLEKDWSGGAVQLAFSNDGKFLAAWCASDGSVRVWDLATGKYKVIMANVGDPPGGPILTWSPDGRSLAIAGRKVQVWELGSLKVRREILVSANAMDFSLDGRFLATAGTDSTVLVWDL